MSKSEKNFEQYQFNKAATGEAASHTPGADVYEFNFRQGKPAGRQALRTREPFSVQRFLLKYGLKTRRKPVREG